MYPIFSHFVDAFALFTFASPWLNLLIDTCRLNWDGDMFKLFSIYSNLEGDGAIGLLLTVCAYIFLELVTGILCYFYFLYVHMNGRVHDSVLRVEATANELVCPGDLEVSYDELAYLCAVENWQKGGARRVVTLTEHSKMVKDPTLSHSCADRFRWRRERGAKLGDAISDSCRKIHAKTGSVPMMREDATRVWVHTHTSDGQVHLHRAFER